MRFYLLAALVLLASSLAAHADTYQIAITSGSDHITFDVPSSPVSPQQTGSGGFELNNLTFDYNGRSMTGDVAFYPTSTPFPGIEAEIGLNFIATEGIQVFTGTTEVPTFILNSFTSTNTDGLAGSTATVNITDLMPAPPASVTPEPSSIALLGTGLAGIAGMVRKRLACKRQ